MDGLTKVYRFGKKGGALPIPRLGPRRSVASHKKPPREVYALKDLSFEVEPGTILGVIGPNGAGKTTLLRMLAGVTKPTAGRALLRGRVVPMLELGTGFQPDSTGRENIFLNAAFYGIPRQVVERRLDDIVSFAGIAQHLDLPVGKYSSGMYLRLAFSVAINMSPDVLLADEILAVGDIAFQEQCLRRVREAGEQGMTVLFVSHDMDAVRRLCGRTIWINAGELVANGPTEEVVSGYEEASWTMSADEAEEGDHRNKFGEILSTRLLSAETGREIGSVQVSDEVIIRTLVRIQRAKIGFRCIQVFTTGGVEAFRTVQPTVTRAEPGIYRADVRVPAHLLADSAYSVKTGVWIEWKRREDRQYALVRNNALVFKVYDTNEPDSARGTYQGALRGVVRPKLNWDVGQSSGATAAQPVDE